MPMPKFKKDVADMLMERGAFKTGEFKLKLHETNPKAPLSPIYFNLRDKNNPKPGPLEEADYEMMSLCFIDIITREELIFDALAGIPRAGEPFVAGMERNPFFPHSGCRIIELDKIETKDGRCIIPKAGFNYTPSEKVVLIDDLITGGHTKVEAIRAIEKNGAIVVALIVLIDRQQGGRETVEKAGYKLYPVFTMNELLTYYLETGKISHEKYEEIMNYIKNN